MRRARWLLLATLLGGPAFAGEENGEKHAFVEVVALPEEVYVGAPLGLRLRVGIDAEYFRAHAVPLFLRPLDLQVEVKAPWLDALTGATPYPGTSPGIEDTGPRLRLSLNGAEVEAIRLEARKEGGKTFTVVEVTRTWLPVRPGEIVLSPPTLRFAHATRFDDDVVQGRVPVDRRDVVVTGKTLTLQVRALPEEGRPPEWAGAVGRFSVSAAADRAEVAVGLHFTLTLRIAGAGNLAVLDAPRLDSLTKFHVYWVIDDQSPGLRTLSYDIEAVSTDATEVPSIPFAYLDPGPPPAYRVERTQPIPLRVRTAQGTTPAVPAGPPPGGPSGDGDSSASGTLALVAAMLAVVVIGLALLALRRACAAAPSDSDLSRVPAAAAAFRARVSAPGADVGAALTEFLSAVLGCPPSAVISPDLPSRLARAGIPAALAARCAAAVEHLVAARYGGGSSVPAAAAVSSLVADVESSFASPHGPPART